ncbi:hypothetical protein N7481_002936 [Penicillium waksmanii]|uniref:uncharacterized protein n=1 Tax=Penicillium waksmanii TaxID=69791 RepID=UPI002547B306|nr:uncharacterized protein N7481_002936 [Penicillium waksmanii]KAJ5987726.1 hypothetical protein N7481_002936 [Penicillium waksmanii]
MDRDGTTMSPSRSSLVIENSSYHLLTRDRLDKLLDSLTHHEIRRVKARFQNEHFPFDIVGNLPIEVVTLIFKNLPLTEMLRLQRVSSTWKALLSSRDLQSAVLLTRELTCENTQDTVAFIKKRNRIEQGKFVSEIAFTPPHKGAPQWCMAADYSEGHFAWIDNTKFTLNVLNLWTGQLSQFVTEDRQTFSDTKVSNAMVVALARRTCHVWNLGTHEYTNFQLPHPNWTGSFLVHGTNAMFIGRNDSSGIADLIHWSFGSRIARTIPWKDARTIKSLILDPDEEKFIVFHIDDLPDSSSVPSLTTSFIPNVEAHLETFALDDRERGGVFRSTSDRIQSLFLRRDSSVRKSPFRCETHPGQINLNVEEENFWDEDHPDGSESVDSDDPYGAEIYDPELHTWASQRFFSFERNQQLVVHRVHTVRPSLPVPEKLKFISPSPGIIYYAEFQTQWEGDPGRVMVLHASKSDRDPVHDYEAYFEVRKGHGAKIYGDGDFMVFVRPYEMSIHSFNDRAVWNPSQISWPKEILNLGVAKNTLIYGR